MLSLFTPWILLAMVIVLAIAVVRNLAVGAKKLIRWILPVILLVAVVKVNADWEVFSVGRLFTKLQRAAGERGQESFKVLTFNIHSAGGDQAVESIINLIEKEDPDYIYLSECRWQKSVLDSLKNYQYNVNAHMDGWIASKTIASRGLGRTEANSMFITYPDLKLICCHLASNNYFQDKDGNASYVTPDSLSNLTKLKGYLANVDTVSLERISQTRIICDSIKADLPTIVMGDMNDLSNSEALRQLKKAGLKDAWWRGGLGYGATFHEPLPFRIDHIYYSGDLRLEEIHRIDSRDLSTDGIPISDHDCLVATFSRKSSYNRTE